MCVGARNYGKYIYIYREVSSHDDSFNIVLIRSLFKVVLSTIKRKKKKIRDPQDRINVNTPNITFYIIFHDTR